MLKNFEFDKNKKFFFVASLQGIMVTFDSGFMVNLIDLTRFGVISLNFGRLFEFTFMKNCLFPLII